MALVRRPYRSLLRRLLRWCGHPQLGRYASDGRSKPAGIGVAAGARRLVAHRSVGRLSRLAAVLARRGPVAAGSMDRRGIAPSQSDLADRLMAALASLGDRGAGASLRWRCCGCCGSAGWQPGTGWPRSASGSG